MTATFIEAAQEDKVSSDQFISSAGAAKRLDVTTRTITRWVSEGYFPGAFKVNPEVENSPWMLPMSVFEPFEKAYKEGTLKSEEE
jgi:hypothetical protein